MGWMPPAHRAQVSEEKAQERARVSGIVLGEVQRLCSESDLDRAMWEDILTTCLPISEEETEYALERLIDAGKIREPILGIIKVEP